MVYVLVSVALGMLMLMAGAVWAMRYFRRSHKKRVSQFPATPEETYPLGEDNLQVKAAGDSTLKEYSDGSMTSGSGSGLPLAKNIQLLERIGKGRFGEVWKAEWNCAHVAVKIFSTLDEASWVRETEIYSSVMLTHENILQLYGSDMTSRNSTTQLWLVTQYQKNGSLYDYLNRRTLTDMQLLNLAFSMADGLTFLHSELFGTQVRSGIAHRDIKSKNILVNEQERCIIADFGLAVTHKCGELNISTNPKAGTRRYMAPEVLNNSINTESFDAFKRVDMYAVGLVLWEMARRTLSQEVQPPEYQPPFYDVVQADPSDEEMLQVVCYDKYRPEIPNDWEDDAVLRAFSQMIKDCWAENSDCRPSALRVKKSILAIRERKRRSSPESDSGSGKRRDSDEEEVCDGVHLGDVIGKGRFGTVRLATLDGNNVVVKIISTLDYQSWATECEVFSLMKSGGHPNILRCLKLGHASESQLRIVLDYHQRGSLYDVLQTESLTELQILRLAQGVSHGLMFLHKGVTQIRRGISHRDIKSKNVLVSSGTTAVLADFGLAAIQDPQSGHAKFHPGFKVCVGTIRYMAPEILRSSARLTLFEDFRRADVYSFGLVLWELAWNVGARLQPLKGEPGYLLPFDDVVGRDPTVEEMERVVCHRRLRPSIPAKWKTNPVLKKLTEIIRNCWNRQGRKRRQACEVVEDVTGILKSLSAFE